jgi:hypothetical protein
MSTAVMADLPRRRWISVHEYHRMAEVGLLAPDARVELIEGEIIDMEPIGNSHRGTVMWLDRLLQRAVGDHAMVLCERAPGVTALPGVPDAAVDLRQLFETL